MKAEQFVAHRGFQAKYPENTLIGIEAALDAGACWIEIDVHVSRDGVPVVVHDPDLKRVGGSDLIIAQTDWTQLQQVDVGEASRFGQRFAGERLSSLRDVLALVSRYPEARAFVEIKRHTLATRSAEEVAFAVLSEWPIEGPTLEFPVISFDSSILLAIRDQSDLPIGLVLDAFDDAHRSWLEEHQPEWVFCNYQKVDSPLWPVSSKWVMYPVNEVGEAKHWLAEGAALIETDDIGLMLDESGEA